MGNRPLERKRRPTAPGTILLEHFLVPRTISQKAFAADIEVSEKHLSQLVNGKRTLSPDVAARIAKALGTTVRFWINLQGAVDAWDAERARADWQSAVVYGA